MTSDEKPTEQGSMLKHTDEEVLTQRDQPKTTIDTVRAFKTKLTNAESDIQQTSFEAEEVHDQFDYMEVKILAQERHRHMATTEAADKPVISGMENLEVVTRSCATIPRRTWARGLSTVCEYSEAEIQRMVASVNEHTQFIKHNHTQSFSTTHYLRFVLKKRYT